MSLYSNESIYSKISGFYGISDYEQRIASLSQEKHSTTVEAISTKSAKILEKIKRIISKDDSDNRYYGARFHQAVDQALLDISMLRPGRKLFKRLLKSPFPISIRLSSFDTKMDIRYVTETNWTTGTSNIRCAYLTFPTDFLIQEYEPTWRPGRYPIVLGIVHELIHGMHTVEDSAKSDMRGYNRFDLISPKFSNLEEQLTICGLEKKEDKIDICENAFVKAFGYHFRKSHGGIDVYPKRLDDPSTNDLEKVILQCCYEGSFKEVLDYIQSNLKDHTCPFDVKKLLDQLFKDLENNFKGPFHDGLIFYGEDKSTFYEILWELNRLVPQDERIPLYDHALSYDPAIRAELIKWTEEQKG